MARQAAKGEEAIRKAAAKAKLKQVELRVWYEGAKLRKRIVSASPV